MFKCFIALVACCITSLLQGSSITLVTQKKSHYSHYNTDKLKSLQVQLENPKTYNGFDIQYGKSIKAMGYDLLATLPPAPPNYDALLLHFKNGMRVPVMLADAKAMKIFIATQIYSEIHKKYTSEFPGIIKTDPIFNDPRPIKFMDNKIVVRTESYSISQGKFNPFHYTDSLHKIEWIKYKFWTAFSYVAGNAEVIAGREVFLNRCQYCHRINGKGATFGWDFVDPLPIYQKRNPKSLLFHVKYKKIDALERGLMMPPQTGITAAEAQHLWQWMKAIALKELKK